MSDTNDYMGAWWYIVQLLGDRLGYMASILVDDEFFCNNFMDIQAHHTESGGKS